MSLCSNFNKNIKCSKSKQTMSNILLNEHKQGHLLLATNVNILLPLISYTRIKYGVRINMQPIFVKKFKREALDALIGN